MLILKYVIFIAGLADIDQVIGDLFSIHSVSNWAARAAAKVVFPEAVGPRIVISSYDFMIQTYEKKGHPQRG